MAGNAPKMIGIIFDAAERQKIIAEAQRKGVKTMSDIIRIAVAEYFENHKEEIGGGK